MTWYGTTQVPQILPQLVIVTSSLPAATVGTAYSVALVAQSPLQPITWSVLSDSPDTGNWLTLNPITGVLSGTPGTAETETLTVQATDSGGRTATQTYSLVVSGSGGGGGLAFNNVFNFTSFAGSPSIIGLNGSSGGSIFSGGNLLLLPASGHQNGQAWYTPLVNIQQFTTTFVFSFAGGLGVPSSAGFGFKIQPVFNHPNDPNGNLNGDANLCGIGWFTPVQQIPNQVAIKFDMSPAGNAGGATTWRVGGQPSSIGLYINGGPSAGLVPQDDLQSAGINFYSGHHFQATLVYDGTLLTITLLDLTSLAQFRKSWPVNIPAVQGANTATVGFGAGQVANSQATIYSWSYSTGGGASNARLATPSIGLASGTYSTTQNVSITGPAGASIYYTTNGQSPTSAGTLYSGPVAISSTAFLQAIAIESGFTDSLVTSAMYVIGTPGTTPTVNFPSGFAGAASLINPVGIANFNGANLQLTPGASPNDVGGAWFVSPVNVSTFSGNRACNFTFTFASGVQGMCFVIQNEPPALSPPTNITQSWVSGGITTMANPATGLGYSGLTGGTDAQIAGILSSIAIRLDDFQGPSFTGLYQNGADVSTGGSSTSPVNLAAGGHTYTCALSYDGTTLSMTLHDVNANTTFIKTFAVNIPVVVGGSIAYVGFTASTGGGAQGAVAITTWTGF